MAKKSGSGGFGKIFLGFLLGVAGKIEDRFVPEFDRHRRAIIKTPRRP